MRQVGDKQDNMKLDLGTAGPPMAQPGKLCEQMYLAHPLLHLGLTPDVNHSVRHHRPDCLPQVLTLRWATAVSPEEAAVHIAGAAQVLTGTDVSC